MKPNHSLKTLLLTLFALLLLVFYGCGNHSHIHQQLLHAEDLMEEHPDSAYAIVSSLKIDSTTPEEDRALHALLLTQAMDKIGIIDQTDVERLHLYGADMDKAISYFVRKKQNNLAMKSYYYKGIITYNLPDSFIYSLEPFSISLDYAIETDDAFYIARNYNMMSEIYRRAKAYDDEVQAQQSALTYFSKTGKKQFIDYSRYSLSKALYNAGRHEEAVAKLDSLLTDLSDDETSALSVASMNLRARALYYSSLFKECANQIERIDSLGFHAPDLVLFYAASYIGMDSISRARRIMESMSEDLDSEDKSILDNLLYSKTSSHTDEYESLSRLYYRLAEDYKDITKGNLNTVQTLVNRNAAQRHHLEHENMRLKQVLLIIVAFILVSIMIFIILRVNRRRRNAEKELDEQYSRLRDAQTELQNLLADFQEKETELKSISREKEKVIKEKEYAISKKDDLEAELIEIKHQYVDARSDITILRKAGLKFSRLLTVLSKEKDKSTLSPRTTLGKIKIEFDKYRPGARNLKDWETLLNQKYDNILENLSNDIPDLTKEEKAISVYLIMGFTNASICYLCNLKGRQEEFMITKLRNKIKALPEEKRKRYRLLMSTTQEEDN